MDEFLEKLRFLIRLDAEEAGSVEAWCWEKDLPKSTISAFLTKNRLPSITTIFAILNAVGARVEIDLSNSELKID